MAEWWYNTSFYTSLRMTHFRALYGFSPPQVAEISWLMKLLTLLQKCSGTGKANQIMKANTQQAHESLMVHFANKNRSDRELEIGDMVYLKIYPCRHSSLSIHQCIKLHSKF
jgi:hypothetical protein